VLRIAGYVTGKQDLPCSMCVDRNFDDLAQRFMRNVYATPKGRLRLAIMEDELQRLLPRLPTARPLRILDAGCGQGPLSRQLARLGHQLVLCDHSAVMLQEAQATFAAEAPGVNVQFIHASIQELAAHLTDPFDLVMCHAVLEWQALPEQTLRSVVAWLKPGGVLSLLFYNRHGLIWRNLTRGNFRKVASDNFSGHPSGLTPTHPLLPQQVYDWLDELELAVVSRCGVRVLYDYLGKTLQASRSYEDILAMERQFCREEPYLSLGRYIHVVAEARDTESYAGSASES